MKTHTEDKEDSISEQEEKQQMINKTKDDKTEEGQTTGGLDAAQAKKKKYIKWGIIGGIILVIVILAIVLPVTLIKKDNGGGDNPPSPPPQPVPPGYNPYEIDPNDMLNSTYGYSGIIKAATSTYSPVLHQRALKKLFAKRPDILASSTGKLNVDSKGIPQGVNNNFTQYLFFSMGMTKWRVAHFTLTDNNNTRYSVPEQSVPKPADDQSMRLDMLGFSISLNPFGFSFADPLDKSNVFVNTIGQTLVFMDKFIQMDFKLPSQRIYGFGERVREFNLQEGTWTMWAIGQNSPYDDGTGRLGVYGVHPFILVQGKNKGDYIGLYFRNSNAQSPVLTYTEDGSLLSYVTTGGQIDVYFFIHGTASEIIKSYQSYFGKPRVPPFWSMGWHQASYAWENITMVKNVSDSYANYQFPLDALYLDIPYMDNYTDFTVNQTAFPNLTDYVDGLHQNNMKLVVIVDAGISADNTSNPYYTLGNQNDVFIKSGKYLSKNYSNNLILQVWSNKTVFVDWFNSKSLNLWAQGLNDLYNKTHFDGIWTDMNEPTGFAHGELVPDDAENITTEAIETPLLKSVKRFLEDNNYDYTWYTSIQASNKSTYDLPFIPRFINQYTNQIQNFDNWTLSLNASHPSLNETEYNLHSLYGHMMANKTFFFLAENESSPLKDKRPFVLTRSSFTSTGKYASHWLGDNFRDWKYMKYSISGIMNMNMFGIPHVGADICGFFGVERDDEMCARWLQLGTFYPFARLHYDRLSKPNEPYLIEGNYSSMAKQAMLDRYQYIRHIYTCIYEASQNGGTCFDPLFYYYPLDDNLFQDYESTFLVGGALKVTPVLKKLEQNETTIDSYFPQGNWVDLNNPSNIITGNQTVKLSALQNSTQVHLRPGSIISFQNNSNSTGNAVLNTAQLLAKPISLLINRDDKGFASGSLFLDKGETISELSNSNYEYYQISLQANSTLNFQLAGGNRGTQDHTLGEIKLFNATEFADVSSANGAAFSCYLDTNMQAHPMISEYLEDQNALKLTVDGSPAKFSNILSIHFGTNNTVGICDPQSFGYVIANGGSIPQLNVNNISIELQHFAKKLPNINLTMRVLDGDIVNIKWTWAAIDKNGSFPSNKRTPREVPDEFITTTNKSLSTKTLDSFVTITSNQPFSISAFHKTDQGNVNYWTLNGMLFDEYLNWIKVTIATNDTGDSFKGVFGLGERANKDFFYQDGVYGMWARDSLTPDETGKLPGNNMYGTHPIYMFKHNTKAWVGVHYKLANAQDWWITNDKNAGTVKLDTIATGGVADIYIMKELTPDNLIAKYFTLVGSPVLIPQWALGWNQCRWGYTNLDQVKDVVQSYANHSLPLDVQWSDIDYLNQYRNFEYDNHSFAGLPEFIQTLHDNNMRYVPILDAGLAYRPSGEYPAFNTGTDKDVFMKINGEIFIGQVWPNDAAYPDYFANNTVQWWQDNLDLMYKNIPFDGLWEDMNEASNFCNGVCYQSQAPADPVKNKLKYIPTGRDLETKSMALDTMHANGYIQLDTHSYYGTQMVKATHEWFQKTNKRTFIIERSSMAGMGKYASRWLGDNFSQWNNMAYSVSGIMLMNMFGITMAGVDICGFILDTNVELCTKWHIAGAFYPFSRNHNNWGQKSQEPYVWDGQLVNGKNALDIMRDAIRTKYSLIRYYYSNLFQVSTQGTGTFYKPMFFEFPENNQAFKDIIYNVMLGSALKLSINPESQDVTTKEFFFPQGVWCSIDGSQPDGECFNTTSTDGILKTFPCGLTDYQLHIRNGYIVPMQDTKNKTGANTKNFSTTVDLQSWPVDLHILGQQLDSSNPYWTAQGDYFNDDGLSLNYTGLYNHYQITASYDSTLNITVSVSTLVNATNSTNTEPNCTAINSNDYLRRIFIYNADNYQNSKAYTVNATMQNGTNTQVGQAAYNETSKILTFTSSIDLCLSALKQLLFAPAA